MKPSSDIKSFLKSHGFTPNDLLGQNFLVDDDALEKIVGAADIHRNDEVLEIGPGIGNLTQLLAAKSDHVLAVEKDERYRPILAEVLRGTNVRVEFADIVRFNFQAQLAPGYKVVANIPYYITGKIIEMLVTARVRPSRIVLLVQREVAERIVAKPGDLSILAIAVQLYCDAATVVHVPKESFTRSQKLTLPSSAWTFCHSRASPWTKKSFSASCAPRSRAGASSCATRCGQTCAWTTRASWLWKKSLT